jgi:hypothetical protein
VFRDKPLHENHEHYREHDHRHEDKHQRALGHVSEHAEPRAFRQQIHAALWAFSGALLANFPMHGAKIDSSRALFLIHVRPPIDPTR